MSRVAYAFDKATSPVKRTPNANVVVHPEAQYMAMCQFTNVYWDHDSHKNYAPILRFEGEVERLDAIGTKFPHNFDTLYFGENKPKVTYAYSFDENQLAELAKKGFWSEEGVIIPEKFSTAKFQLEANAVIEELTDTYDKDKVPTFNVSLSKPHENQFDVRAYSLAQFITRKQKEEAKVIEVKGLEQEMGINDLVEKSKELLEAEKLAAQQASYKPKSIEEVAAERASANIAERVSSQLDDIQARRDENNARVEAERAAEAARLKAEQEAAANAVPETKDKDTVEFNEAVEIKSDDVRNLTGGVEANKYENNSSIFDASEDIDEELPDNVAELMKKLGGGQQVSDDVSDNADTVEIDDDVEIEPIIEDKPVVDNHTDNNASNAGSDSNNDSGAASGAQGLGVYTFEDQSTAQFEVRGDVNGNKSDEEKKDEAEEKLNDEKAEAEEIKADKTAAEADAALKKARLDTAINNTTVTVANKDKSDRSK